MFNLNNFISTSITFRRNSLFAADIAMNKDALSREINGNDHINTSMFNTGVYVFRLVGETVMTQKIVVR